MNPIHRRAARQQGVSLIEALVALAVMAIGMLGLVGVQSTLRANSDVAKQRSEALRIAQAEVEKWRGFTVLTSTGTNPPGYADIASSSAPASAAGVNAEYTIDRTVTHLGDPRKGKTLKVQVSWTDRTNNAQQVQLSTLVAGIAPELGATLVVGGDGDSVGQQPRGRNRGIPLIAKDLGDGTSGFIPPGAPTGVAWRFDNITGVIRLCTTSAATTGDLANGNITCGSDYALLLAGYVRYSLGASAADQPSASTFDSLPPESSDLVARVIQTTPTVGVVSCYEAPYDAVTLSYYCAIPVLQITGGTPSWSGSLRFNDSGDGHPDVANSADDDDDRDRRVCRYHSNAGYDLETRSRLNQNYLLIRAGNGSDPYPCPTPTLLHQPAP